MPAGCAEMLGTRLDSIPINPAVEGFDAMLEGSFADKDVDITEENIQSRIRGVTLMALSNKFGPHAAYHRQQERNERRLCDHLW